MFSKFENSFTFVSNNIYWQKRLNWAFLMHAFAKIHTKGKYRLKIKHFLLNTGINKPSFCQSIDNLELFGIKMFSQEM